jgi:hypothetical protein
VRQALASQKITYAALAEELGMPNARNLNFVLGSIATTLVELTQRWQEEVPRIQCIVINQQTGLPGAGVDPMLTGGSTSKLDPRQKEAIVDRVLGEVFGYPKWPAVLTELGLPTAKQPSPPLISESKTMLRNIQSPSGYTCR